MQIQPDLYELLYVSLIAPDTHGKGVARIAREARVNNTKNGITGLLVFDGERFAQHIEGHAQGVRKLFERIEADPRHTEVHVVQQGSSLVRKFPNFSMGFAEVGELELLESLDLQEGNSARSAFTALLPSLDMEP
jgi:hypothetical protein